MVRRAKDYLATHRTADVALLVIITLLATRGWLNMQVPMGHDTVADMLLAQASGHTLSIHSLFSGWTRDWFLGYPLFYVHTPFVPLMIAAFSLPFGWVLGTKLLYLSFFILSGVFAYFYVFELTRSRPASLAAGLAYAFLPYHVLEAGFEGHHGAFGLPYMLTPLILLSIERLVGRPGLKPALITALLLTALTLTYAQILPLLIGPFLALYTALRIWWERKRGLQYVRTATLASAASLTACLLLTAFWWLPLPSEIRYSAATTFPLDEARGYSANLWQAITLRPEFCCAPASAWGASGSTLTEIMRLLPFALVALGLALNRRNRYAWLFSAAILIATILAMGPASPIRLFSLAYRIIPFFSGLRTPWRFLLVSSLAYAVLIGFTVKAAIGWWAARRPRQPGHRAIAACVLGLTSLVVIGNTWGETRTAFATFTLPEDQQQAFEWIKAQEDGDYRITDLPFNSWTYSAEHGWVIDPVNWNYLHGKDTVYGGIPAAASVYAADTLDHLNSRLQNGARLDEWLSLFDTRYVMLDRTDPATGNIALGEGFRLAWSSPTIDIYENAAARPRVFSVSVTDERQVALWSDAGISAFPLDAGIGVTLSLEARPAATTGLALEAGLRFTQPEAEWSGLGINIGGTILDGDDSLCLLFYSQDDLPDLYVSLDALEADGSRYGMDLDRVDGIKAGWNEIRLPLSLMLARSSTDEDGRLDPDQVATLWLGVGEESDPGCTREFSLYFDSLSVVSEETGPDVQYTRTGAGQYRAHVTAGSAFRLVLSEAYHPNWVARVNGVTVHSEMSYESLNGFDLPPGEYDVTLEFVPSPLRTAGTIITLISLMALLLAGAFVAVTKARRRRLSH